MKYIIASDIHIDDYNRYNLPNNKRGDQFDKLAQLLISKGKLHYSKRLILAGDLINKPTNRPKTYHKFLSFIDILCSYFEDIYFINGQHDLDTKSDTQNFEDSYTTILHNYKDKVRYMHQKYINDKDHLIYFQNWTKSQDLTNIDKVDLFIGHVTIGNELFKGQEDLLDYSKFDLAVVGDIHKHKVYKNVVCIGSPIQVNTCRGFNQ